MLILEALRQAAIATAHLSGLPADGALTLSNYDSRFFSFADKGVPVTIRVFALRSPLSAEYGQMIAFARNVFQSNGGRGSSTATWRPGSVPTPPTTTGCSTRSAGPHRWVAGSPSPATTGAAPPSRRASGPRRRRWRSSPPSDGCSGRAGLNHHKRWGRVCAVHPAPAAWAPQFAVRAMGGLREESGGMCPLPLASSLIGAEGRIEAGGGDSLPLAPLATRSGCFTGRE